MAKVPVGGTNGLVDRLLTLVGYRATSTTTDPERVECTNALEYAEKFIAQSESLLYLDLFTTLNVASSGLAAVPSDCDYGKAYTIETADGLGEVAYRPTDEFVSSVSAGYDRVGTTAAAHTIITDAADSTLKFRFKPAIAATLNITYQRIPPVLADDASSKSLLPEGYELTLLLTIAEQYVKRRRQALDADFLDADAKAMLTAFYDKFRSSKESTMTDQSRMRRKVEQDALAPGGRG